MLTRKLAIERLRTLGTLNPGGIPTNSISLSDATDPLARKLQRIVQQSRSGRRSGSMLAPANVQMVLP